MAGQQQKKHRLLVLVDAALVAVMLVAGVMLIVTLARYRRERDTYTSAAERVVSTPAPSAAPTETPQFLSADWKPPAQTPPITVDFPAVQAEGKRVAAWLYSEDTPINYPVVQHADTDFYLTHDYTGARAKSGSLFFDTRIGTALAEDNIIIFGHHMKDQSMFGSLVRYCKQDYFDRHRTLYLLTPEVNYRIDVFAAWTCDGVVANFPVMFASPEAREAFYTNAVDASGFVDPEGTYSPYRQMISLVTCSYAAYEDNVRFQVNGWLTPLD